MLAAPAVADESAGVVTAGLSAPFRDTHSYVAVPEPLSLADADRYKQIVRLQEHGDWRGADRLISRLSDYRLLGHVMALRFLHTKYKTSYGELRDWLAKYGDLPQAPRINGLAWSKKPAGADAPKQPTATVVDRIGNPDSRTEATGASWQAGLAEWRAGNLTKAAKHFERVATSKKSSSWGKAAGAFWAARSHLKNHRPENVSHWLKVAAEHPRTFYGQLARRALGMAPGLNWVLEPLTDGDAQLIADNRAGSRALGLIQIGLFDLAEEELHLLLKSKSGKELASSLLAVANAAGLPSLSMRLGMQLERADGVTLDAALYPVPTWAPMDGFVVDPALLYALMRQESGFDPLAKSPVGAAGLMQLMPATADYVDVENDLDHRSGSALFNPRINMTLAQRYVLDLLSNKHVGGDLMMLALAYNAGPGNLAKWRKRANYDADPLLFVESIPVKETRQYIKRVLTYYWIYQERMGSPTTSLDALASGIWPLYSPPSGLMQAAVADNVSY